MLKNIRMGVKLVGAFFIVALLVLVVGFVGMIGLRRLNVFISDIGQGRLPAVESLLRMENEVQNIRGSVRTLLSSRLTLDDRQRQYDNIDSARADYGEYRTVYEKFPKASEESRKWTEATRLLGELTDLNNSIVDLSKKVEESGIIHPDSFKSTIIELVNDHHVLMEQAIAAIGSGTVFTGGDDAESCDLGQFLLTFKTDNPVLLRVLKEVPKYHDAFHEGISEVQDALSRGDRDTAFALYQDKVVRNATRVFELLNQMLGEADRVVQLYDEMNLIAMGDAATVQRSFVDALGWVVSYNSDLAANTVDQAIVNSGQAIRFTIVGMVVASLLALILGLGLTQAITAPMRLGVNFAKAISLGDLGIELSIRQKDEVGQLAEAMREMQIALQDKARVLERIADGDLSVDAKKASEKDGLGESMLRMKKNLNDLLGQVHMAVEQVTAGADQVSQASQSLSQGATEQASSLEEVSSSATEINSQARQNAENATEANALAKKAAADAKNGNSQMMDLKEAMAKINVSSDQIKKVVKVIDDIAFQINLLALNANVEAARAGKYGKGFAVVAEEVRNLAVRSASAVQETTSMVEESIRNIELGNAAVGTTAGQLESIVDGAGKVADFLEEIATASREQAQAIDQISEGLDQIDQVTQSNTASAEESASASEELAGQAQQLQGLIRQFILDERYVSGLRSSGSRSLPAPGGRRVPRPSKERTVKEHPREEFETGIAPVSPEDVIKLDDDDFDRF
ncbi:methyl-accepting chemotaxis protein [Sediminispirochaeta smaragdinae]|uniref:Methyl-accepting chemotaxis sensory transducer n=1 Tax=Sediminispirochaeta smaragdinae (strain DSM 11293 / JCM 15392 / SEBR 4228) TaxID=573413 RepID=E1RAC0_SEDSS|nr:methyl-accepting chemotaxis protein [Sediminispirochaeta smaragdinae]ADK79411.1 methyl-accepting chemotaxis sensory transducer [Sediminispirochaeta smaragdinae DSM 11293]